MRGRYAGKALLECALDGGPTWAREIPFKGGVGNRKRALSIIRPRLEEEHPSGPVEDVTLTLDDLTGESGTQLGLLPEARESNKRRLVEVDRELRARTGGSPALYRVVGVAPWHPAPEMRALRVPVDSSARDEVRSLSSPVPVVVREGRDRQPEAVLLGSRWREVSRIEEQWGFDLWWMSRPMTRTYYRVRGEDGVEVTLFRDDRGGCWYRQGRLAPRQTMTSLYAELHLKSFYSFGLGASHSHELLARAKEYGYDSLALTDTNLCGALEFARLAGSLGIRPITGGELTLTDGTRLVLLARTRRGYGNLSRLFTLANAVDRREPRLDPEHLPHHAEGLILLTGGRDGPVSKLLLEGRRRDAGSLLKGCMEWFGPDSVYVEVQRNYLQGDAELTRASVGLALDLGAPILSHPTTSTTTTLSDTGFSTHWSPPGSTPPWSGPFPT